MGDSEGQKRCNWESCTEPATHETTWPDTGTTVSYCAAHAEIAKRHGAGGSPNMLSKLRALMNVVERLETIPASREMREEIGKLRPAIEAFAYASAERQRLNQA